MDRQEFEILKRFVNSKTLVGTYFTDVGVGSGDFHGVIDAVCVLGLRPEREPSILPARWERMYRKEIKTRRAWVLEVKRELNFEAIGQVLVYAHFFKRAAIVGKGIICEKASKALEEVARNLGIKIFKV